MMTLNGESPSVTTVDQKARAKLGPGKSFQGHNQTKLIDLTRLSFINKIMMVFENIVF